MAKRKKQEDDGFYRDKNGRLDYPPDHIGKKTYISCHGFDYSIPKDYTYLSSGTRYFLGDPKGPEANTLMPMYKGTDIRHKFTKQGPAPEFKQKLSSMKRWYKNSNINDWS